MSYYRLPESTDFNAIPQDPRNPLTKAKVALGGFLFHETAISVDAKDSNLNGTFSCASCHHASAGFQAGTFQGIGEGGQGFGVRGENRTPMSHIVDADVQPVKSPSSMNGAYQPNQLWNGQFGATYLNEGTEVAKLNKAMNKLKSQLDEATKTVAEKVPKNLDFVTKKSTIDKYSK